MNTPSGIAEIISQFGDPHPYIGDDGQMDEVTWKADYLAYAPLPVPLPLDWNRATSVTRTLCHKLMVSVFEDVLQKIVDAGLAAELKTYGGCYAYRPQRGSTKLSTHLWGIAIDLNPFENQLGTAGNMSRGVIDAFNQAGFLWGGDFHSRKDPMHFQFATGY